MGYVPPPQPRTHVHPPRIKFEKRRFRKYWLFGPVVYDEYMLLSMVRNHWIKTGKTGNHTDFLMSKLNEI